MLLALLVVPSQKAPALTIVGRVGIVPERDAALYLSAGLLSLALAAALPAILDRAPSLRRLTMPFKVRRLPWWAAVTVAASALSLHLLGFLRARRYLIRSEPIPPRYIAPLVVVIIVTAIASLLSLPSRRATHIDTETVPALTTGRRPIWRHLVEAAVVTLLVAAVFTPSWRLMTGQTYMLDGLLHWDYFAMGPTLAFGKGASLGSGVHTFYGFGWPLLFRALSPVLPVSYSHMIGVAVVCGSVYVVGVYALLRALTRHAVWATTGTLLALLLHLFSPSAAPFSPYWGFPSLGFPRYVFDVWVFLFLVVYLRSRRNGWMVAAGALAGLAILFEIDTGAYLAGAVGFFALCTLRHRLDTRTAVVAAAGGGLVLLVGLGVGGHWTLLHREFWSGWLENMRATSSGLSMEPLTTEPPTRTIVMFVAMTAFNLVVAGHVLRQALRRRASADAIVVGTVAFYGFLVALYFVGRSTAYNLPRATTPFAIVLIAVLASGCRHLLRQPRLDGSLRSDRCATARRVAGALAPVVATAVVVGLVATNPVFTVYPSVLRKGLASAQVSDLCVIEVPRDICGLPPAGADQVADFRRIVARLRQLTPRTGSLAVLDQTGPSYHLASDTRPWGRYQPLLLTLMQRWRLDEVKAQFRRDPPDVVLMRSADLPLFADSMSELRDLVRARFVVADEVGEFQIWRHAPSQAAEVASSLVRRSTIQLSRME